jgi:DNA mismatch repair protein MutL
MDKIQHKNASSQKLLFPEMIELTVGETSVLISLSDELKYLGFDIGNLGGNTFSINAEPSDMGSTETAKMLRGILSEAMDSNLKTTEKRREKLALSLAKSTAIKTGDQLSNEEMELLISSLFSIENHGITPEGNRILTIIADDELGKRI